MAKKKKKEPHWITRLKYPGTSYPFFDNECSNCGYKAPMVLKAWKHRCPKCGEKLV